LFEKVKVFIKTKNKPKPALPVALPIVVERS